MDCRSSTLTVHIRMSSKELNATAASLLGFLQSGPKTGWDLVQEIEHSVGYFWNITRSQVYRELKTLDAEGYVTEKRAGARDKVPYAITPAGRTAFGRWLAEEPGPDLLRLPIVLTVFFGRDLPPDVLRRYLAKARREHEARLDEYKKLRELPEANEDPFPAIGSTSESPTRRPSSRGSVGSRGIKAPPSSRGSRSTPTTPPEGRRRERR